jgi:hypothetical protein
MSAVNSNPTLGFSYTQNGLYSTASGAPITDINNNTYYANTGTKWEYLDSTSANFLSNTLQGQNPAPLTCNSVKGCPGTFNINNNYNNPVNNTSNDRVNYLASDATPLNTSRASTEENFNNFKNIIRFPYVPTEGSVNNMYCFEPNGPNNKGCEDGYICAQMDGVIPLEYQDTYFTDNQQKNSTTFQGPSTNICYGGNFNLVNTNYESNKKDPIQPNTSTIRTPLYPERGVTLYQNPGCNRENNPDGKNNKYIAGTIKYEGKGVEIFGNCDVCFYANPFVYSLYDSNNNPTYNRYMSLNQATTASKSDNIFIYKPCDSTGFTATSSSAGNKSIFEVYGDVNIVGGHPSAMQAVANIPSNTSCLMQCITIVRNDGVMSSIEYIDPSIQSELSKYGTFSMSKVANNLAILDDNYGYNYNKLIYENDNLSSTYNYVKYSGDYGLRILPNDIHDASSDGLGLNDITKNKLLKGIVLDPTINLQTALDLNNSPIYGYYSDICPIPSAPNTENTDYVDPNGFVKNNQAFNLTVSSIFDGFSSIYIPPHMEVISTHSYDINGNIIKNIYPVPIRYENSPLGDGCFPSFHPSDIFGIYGNSLIAISVRVRKDSTFVNKYIKNTSYNATAKSLEKPAPANLGTISMFRPDVLLVDPNPDNIPNITKGEYYQHGSNFPIEDAYSGYITFNTKFKDALDGKKPGWFANLKKKLKGTNPNIEMLYNSITTFKMNPSINVFSLEWLYVLYYCAMTNIGNGDGSGGCQATYVNYPSGSLTGLLGDGYTKKCTINNIQCLLFNKPLGCNTCNLTGNNMVLASGTTNVCGDAAYSQGNLGPSSADQFMLTYCSVMSNKIFPFYFSIYQAGNMDCACLANIGSCPFNNWLPCSQTSDQYKNAGKSGAYIQCASSSATSTRNCQESAINCSNYNYQYNNSSYNSGQTANLTGTCLTIETDNSKDNPPPPPPTETTNNKKKIEYALIILLVVIVAIIILSFGIYQTRNIFKKK